MSCLVRPFLLTIAKVALVRQQIDAATGLDIPRIGRRRRTRHISHRVSRPIEPIARAAARVDYRKMRYLRPADRQRPLAQGYPLHWNRRRKQVLIEQMLAARG